MTADEGFNSDFLDILECMAEASVEFVVVAHTRWQRTAFPEQPA